MQNSLNDAVVIVTGAAGNMGQAVAECVVARGGRLVLVDRKPGRLQKIFPDWRDETRVWFADDVDMDDARSVSDMAAEALRRFGRVDGLVNTVGGFGGGKPLHEADLAEWDKLFNLNVRTMVHACRAVIPAMIAAGRGRIITIGSRNALQGSPDYAAYSAAKAAVVRTTESMAGELKPHGINVNCIVPGTLDTPQNRKAMPDADTSKWVTPPAVAEVIVFLVSEAAGAVSGATVPVLGGS